MHSQPSLAGIFQYLNLVEKFQVGVLFWVKLALFVDFEVDGMLVRLLELVFFFNDGLKVLLYFLCFFHGIVFDEFESLNVVHLLFELFFSAVWLFWISFNSNFVTVFPHHFFLFVVDKSLFLLLLVVHEAVILIIHFFCLRIFVYRFSPSFERRLKGTVTLVCL